MCERLAPHMNALALFICHCFVLGKQGLTLCCPGWPPTHNMAGDDLEFPICLRMCWDYRCGPPHLACLFLEIEPKALRLLTKRAARQLNCSTSLHLAFKTKRPCGAHRHLWGLGEGDSLPATELSTQEGQMPPAMGGVGIIAEGW